MLPFFFVIASRFHRVDVVAPVTTFLLNVLGSSASFSGGDVFVQSADKVYSFIPSWDALGLYPMLNVLLGGYCLFYMFSAPKKYYLLLPVTLLLYMVIRYLVIIFAFLEIQKANVFWRLDVLTLSMLPLPWLLARTLPRAFEESAFILVRNAISHYNVQYRWFAASVVVFALSCITFFGFVDPGEKKQGRILIDEKHSDWEWTTEEFNTTWYGEKSTYNYYSLAEYLKYFYTVDQKSQALTEEVLKNYDILFIKTPTEPFSQTEIAAIRTFVEHGGGLFLVGDHTNVFGITTNLNPVASQFGITFRYDGQYDLDGELSIYRKPKVLPHPVVQAMPTFMFATSCMLDAPLLAENAIIGYGIKSIYLDYARKNFFPKDAGSAESMEFGLFVQAAGVTFGKGRVFLFSDSTVWSNFYMFIPGKPELLLGIMEWLNRRNSIFGILRLISLVLGVTALLMTIVLARKLEKGRVLSALLFVGFLVTPPAVLAVEQLNRKFYPLPQPHTKYVRVNFESEHSDFELPLLHITQRPEQSYHTFYVWLQRLGYVPSLKSPYEEALQDADAVVIINPHKPFGEQEIQRTEEFLTRGGKLFLMDDPRHTHHVIANQLLSEFGAQLIPTDTLSTRVIFIRAASDTGWIVSSSAGEVRGGMPLLYARTRVPSPSQRQFPTGALIPGHDFDLGKQRRIPLQPFSLDSNLLRQQQQHGTKPPLPRAGWPQPGLPRTVPSPNLLGKALDTITFRPVLAVQNVGKGRLVVMASSFLFTDKDMGSSSVTPDTNKQRIYELEYRIFQDVLKVGKEP